jgi:hypothetical protein
MSEADMSEMLVQGHRLVLCDLKYRKTIRSLDGMWERERLITCLSRPTASLLSRVRFTERESTERAQRERAQREHREREHRERARVRFTDL